MSETTISVAGDAGYDITVGRDILDRVAGELAPTVRKVLVVHPPTLGAKASALREHLLADGTREVLLAEIPAGTKG